MREAFGIRPYDSGPGVTPGPDRPATQVVWPSGPAPAAGSVPGAGWGSGEPAGGVGAGSGAGRGSGGQATEFAGGQPRSTTPGLTERGQGPGDWPGGPSGPGGPTGPYDGGGRARPAWRSPGALVGVLVLLIVLGAGGAYFALKGNGTTSSHGGGHRSVLAPPGFSTAVAQAVHLPVHGSLVSIGDNPFGLAVSKDGKFAFAVTPTALRVLHVSHGTLTPAFQYTIANQPLVAKGVAMTSDGKDLLVAAGNGIDVLGVAEAEAGAGSANVGTLTVPGLTSYGGAVEVAVSPDNKFAFVTLQFANEVAVFNLHRALTTGDFSSGSFVGTVRLSPQPVGMAVSTDGQSLYVASFGWRQHQPPGQGVLSVLSMPKLESGSLSSAKVTQVTTGFSAARVIASPDGKTVWVTARESNFLVGFSAPLLLSDPAHALIAKVQVGMSPIGEILVNGGARMIVADTDTQNSGKNSLAVVDIAKALAVKPALLGYIGTGLMPREFALVGGAGRYLLVSDNGSAQVQVVDLSKLP